MMLDRQFDDSHRTSLAPGCHINGLASLGFRAKTFRRHHFRRLRHGGLNFPKVLRRHGEDPFGKKSSEEISKKALETLLVEGDPEAAAVVHGAIENFAHELARVIAKFVELKPRREVERLAIGGGFRESRVGELAIARAGILLNSKDIALDIRPIRNHPDDAGPIGAVHLAPAWMFKGHDAVLAADIGGTNMRAGLVLLRQSRRHPLKAAAAGATRRRVRGAALRGGGQRRCAFTGAPTEPKQGRGPQGKA